MPNAIMEDIASIFEKSLIEISENLKPKKDGNLKSCRERVQNTFSSILDKLMFVFGADAAMLTFWDSGDKDGIDSDFDVVYQKNMIESNDWWNEKLLDRDKWDQCPAIKSGKIETNQTRCKSCWIKPSSGLNDTICFPIRKYAKTSGIICISYKEELDKNKNKDITLLAQNTFPAMQTNIRLFQSELETIQVAYILYKLDLISQEENIEKCLDKIIKISQQFVNGGEIGLLQRYGGHLAPFLTQEIPDDIMPQSSTLKIQSAAEGGYTCHVGFTRNSFYCRNVEDAARYPYYRKVKSDTKSQYTVPLIYRSNLVGVLNLGFTTQYGFSRVDRTIIEAFSLHVANIMYFKKLLDELRTSTHRAKNNIDLFLGSKNDITMYLPDSEKQLYDIVEEAIINAKGIISETLYPLREENPCIVNLLDIIKASISEISPHLKSRNIEIIGPSVFSNSIEYFLAENHLKDLLRNIFWNAIEALEDCPRPVIEISIKEKQEATIRYLLIEIRDNGRGFKQKSPKSMFSVDPKSKVRVDDGILYGMGLHICDHILSLYGGFLDLARCKEGDEERTITSLYLRAEKHEIA